MSRPGPRRWLIVTGDLPPSFTGGVASWVEDLASALVEQGDVVTVLGRAGGSADAAWDAARPFAVRRVPGRSWARWQHWWTDLWGRGLLSEVDAVVFSTWPLARRLGPAAQARALPVAIAFHGSDLTRLEAPPEGFGSALRGAALLPVSAFLSGELLRLGAPAGRVLPMPLRVPALPERPRRGLLCVARLTPLKGVDRAIRLAQALGEPLSVIGEGPELDRLRAIAGPETDFLGRRDRSSTLEHMAGCAATLLLSRADADGRGAEGLGLTLIEAMSLGCRAIASPTGGLVEAVGPGLVLADPDAPDLAMVWAFLADAEAPERARRWARSAHGPHACVAVLREAIGR